MLGPFDYAFNQTIGYEGAKYTDDPDDRGGPTKYGITEAVYKSAIKRKIISPVSVGIRNLTEREAKAIYLYDYWNRMRLNEVVDQFIASEIFDTAVNMGRKAAATICQKALNYLGESLEEDGIMGPKTINALNRWSNKDPRALHICLNGFQFMRYAEIVKDDGTQQTFARGWTRRVQSYRT